LASGLCIFDLSNGPLPHFFAQPGESGDTILPFLNHRLWRQFSLAM